MKKIILLIFVCLIALFCVSCVSTAQGAPIGETPLPIPTELAPAEPELAAPVNEYGNTKSIISDEDGLSCHLVYPFFGAPDADDYISTWVNDLYSEKKNEMTTLIESNPDISGELTLLYSTRLVSEEYVSLEFSGTFKVPDSSTSHIIKTMVINIKSGEAIEPQLLFTDEGRAVLPQLIGEELSAKYPFITNYINPDESWLENAVLMPLGIDFLLTSAEIPSYIGLQRIGIGYGKLNNAISYPDNNLYKPDPNMPAIALTFDDGPSQVTEKLLDLLGEFNIKATFCVLGNKMAKHEDTIRRMAEEGHEVIGHSWSHPDMSRLSNSDIEKQLTKTNELIEEYTGQKPIFHRPPYGAFNSRVKKVSEELDLSILLWSVDPYDWKTRDGENTYNHIVEHIKHGSVVLCHDIYMDTYDAMELLIPHLASEGYRIVTVSELFEIMETEPESGGVYRSP